MVQQLSDDRQARHDARNELQALRLGIELQATLASRQDRAAAQEVRCELLRSVDRLEMLVAPESESPDPEV